jgi:hypothetical protein
MVRKMTLDTGRSAEGAFDSFASDNDLVGMEITLHERARLNQRRYFVALHPVPTPIRTYSAITWCHAEKLDVTIAGLFAPVGRGPTREVTVLGFDDLIRATECKLRFG